MSPTLSTLSTIGDVITLEDNEEAPPAIDRAPVATECQPERSDQYVEHFRQVVWKHLAPHESGLIDGTSRSNVNVFEIVAKSFPP
ncbi:hypothetical protein LTR47_011560, partial [Exophiala xenobiotica]